MNLFRSTVFILSMALTILLESSATANMNYSHVQFSVADGRTLDLRETGSRMVIRTIEEFLKAGDLALLREGFQLDASLNWIFGEIIEGAIDAVVPLWSKDKRIAFTRPRLLFWTRIEEEEHTDGNLGLVYRTNLTDTPISINAIGGTSIFYDHDFQTGHSRISLDAYIQKRYLPRSTNPLGVGSL